MKVAKLTEIGKMEILQEDFQIDEGDLVVKVKKVGICGSDLHYFRHGGLGSFKQDLPMPMGHEVVGTVYQGTEKWAKGTKVAIEPGVSCGKCEMCTIEKNNLCTEGKFMGANAPGALQEYLKVNENQLVEIEDYDFGVMLEPASIGMEARAKIEDFYKDNTNIFISGCGPIGLLTAMLCKASMQPSNILIKDIREYREDFAEEMLGYENSIKITDGKLLADYCFECSGDTKSIDLCHNVVKRNGHIVLVGIPEVDICNYNPHKDRIKAITIHNVRRSNWKLHTVQIDCKKFDNIPIQKLITHRFKFENVQEAFETASNYEDGIIKGIIEF